MFISAAQRQAGVKVFVDHCPDCRRLRTGVRQNRELLGVKNLEEYCENLMAKSARRKQLLVPPPRNHAENVSEALSDFNSIKWKAEHPQTFKEKVAEFFQTYF